MLEFTIDYNKTIPTTVEALRSFISKDFPYIPIFLLTRFELEFNNLLQNFGIFCEHFYLMVFWVRIPSWFQCNRPPKIYYILLSKTYERNVYTIVTLCVGRIVSIIGALSIYRASSHPLFPPLSLSLSLSFSQEHDFGTECGKRSPRKRTLFTRLLTGLGVDQLCLYDYIYICSVHVTLTAHLESRMWRLFCSSDCSGRFCTSIFNRL